MLFACMFLMFLFLHVVFFFFSFFFFSNHSLLYCCHCLTNKDSYIERPVQPEPVSTLFISLFVCIQVHVQVLNVYIRRAGQVGVSVLRKLTK